MAATNGNHHHLTLSDRIYIEQGLERCLNYKDIAAFIRKDPTTISKEIRRHRVLKCQDRKTALCVLRDLCTKKHMCADSFCKQTLWQVHAAPVPMALL